MYGSTSVKRKKHHGLANTCCYGGLYSTKSQVNPDFYNWNMVFVIYCDGSSFTGMREKPIYFKDKPVYFRGKVILEAIIKDLLSRGIRDASDVLLSGSSAGSLAVLIHADFIRSKLNQKTKVRALSDSGYFLDIENQYGNRKIRKRYTRMLSAHNSTGGLHQACIERLDRDEHWKCLFPQYFLELIETPVFVLQSAYDVWQIIHNLGVVCTIPSYQDMPMFSSLKLPRDFVPHKTTEALKKSNKTSRAYRVRSHASRGIAHASREADHESWGINHAGYLNDNFVPHKKAKALRESRKTSRAYRVRSHASRGIAHASRGAKHKYRRTSHASHGTDNEQKLNTFRHKKNYWRSIPARTRTKFTAKYASRASHVIQPALRFNPRANNQHVNHRGHVLSPDDYSRGTFVHTFENTRVLTSQKLRRLRGEKEPHSAINANAAHARERREHKKPGSAQPKLREISKEQTQPYQWHWQRLYSDPAFCTKDERETILTMRKFTIDALKPVLNKSGAGIFLTSCFEHTLATSGHIWTKTKVGGKTLREAIADWYFERPGNHTYIDPELEFGPCSM